jgi:hypothetical protein
MSELSQGPGWWQASNGKWYPPFPPQSMPSPLPPPLPRDSSWRFRRVARWEPDGRTPSCPCGCGQLLDSASLQMARRAMYIDSLLPAYEYLTRRTGEDEWRSRSYVGKRYSDAFWARAHKDPTGPVDVQESEYWEAEALSIAMRLNQEDPAFRASWPGPYIDKTRHDRRRWGSVGFGGF